MSRSYRILVVALAAMVVGLVGARSSTTAAPYENELVIQASGGAFEQGLKQHFYDPFMRETGVTIRTIAAFQSQVWPRVRAMYEAANVEWDIVTSTDPNAEANKEYLLTLDCRAIPNAAKFGVSGTCKSNRLLRTIGGGVIAYSTKAFPTGRHPRGWADFWDVQKFPGPRALSNSGDPWWVLAVALVADGVPPDRLFPMDLDRAFRKLDQLKPHVKVWWRTGDQQQQIMRDGEVVLAMMWSGRALSLKASGVPMDVEWNQAIKDLAYWSVVKSAPHPNAAYAFLNYWLARPDAHLAFGRQTFNDTSNRQTLDLVPENQRRAYATHDANWSGMIDVDSSPWVAENRARIVERWNVWLAR